MDKTEKQRISMDTIRYDLKKSANTYLWAGGISLLFMPFMLIFFFALYTPGKLPLNILAGFFPAIFLGLAVYAGVEVVRLYGMSHRGFRVVQDTLLTGYSTVSSGRRSYRKENYRLAFLHSGEFMIGTLNYRWSPRLSMTDKDLFNCSQDGDSFYVVLYGKKPKIKMVYNCKLFEMIEKNEVEVLEAYQPPIEVFTEKEIREDLRTDKRRIGFVLLGYVVGILLFVCWIFIIFFVTHRLTSFIALLFPVALVGDAMYDVPRYIALCSALRRKELYIKNDRLLTAETHANNPDRRRYSVYGNIMCRLRFAAYGDYLFVRKHYKWSKHHVMSAPLLVRHSQPDDEFYVVLSKPAGGKILAVYNTKHFRLQHGMVTENTYF